MQLNPSEISDIIKSKIDGTQNSSDYRSKGTVVLFVSMVYQKLCKGK